MKRVLLVSAHPDDMEIGMGGTVAKMADIGHSITSVVITDGRRAPDPDSIGPEKMAELRKVEGEKAASVLGIGRTIFFGFETIADEANFQEATRKLSEAIDSFDPEEIYTLHPILDRHSSHRAAGQITLDACKNRDVSIWAYEVWGLFAEWDRFEDISDHIETKLTAINEHRSQVAAIPYTEGVAGLNRWRAIFADPHQATVPCAYAEVFVKLR